MTDPERKLWSALRGNRLDGLHFRRQQVIGDYIVDFYCEAARLAIELDAPSDALSSRADAERDAFLRRNGMRVLRVPNDAVAKDLPAIAEWITERVKTTGDKERKDRPNPRPLPASGRGEGKEPR
jgi:very-short-patch-repair endonuclease